MEDAGIYYEFVYPSIDRKDEFLELYRQRGNDDVFVNLVDKNWESWINDIDDIIHTDKLESGKFLNDFLLEDKR